MRLADDVGAALTAVCGYTVRATPEPISGGGLLISSDEWTSASADGSRAPYAPYKSMRHRMDGAGDWPWIKEGGAAWRAGAADADTVLWRLDASTAGSTFLKAFEGAPDWTLAELRAVASVFESHGFKCAKLPREKTLVTTTRYGIQHGL